MIINLGKMFFLFFLLLLLLFCFVFVLFCFVLFCFLTFAEKRPFFFVFKLEPRILEMCDLDFLQGNDCYNMHRTFQVHTNDIAGLRMKVTLPLSIKSLEAYPTSPTTKGRLVYFFLLEWVKRVFQQLIVAILCLAGGRSF